MPWIAVQLKSKLVPLQGHLPACPRFLAWEDEALRQAQDEAFVEEEGGAGVEDKPKFGKREQVR
jgi:hypothetical protein